MTNVHRVLILLLAHVKIVMFLAKPALKPANVLHVDRAKRLTMQDSVLQSVTQHSTYQISEYASTVVLIVVRVRTRRPSVLAVQMDR